MRRIGWLLLGILACAEREPAPASRSDLRIARDSADSAYALVQQRGHAAMGVDQYTSSHSFEPLPDGGRITLERNSNDPAGVAQIRQHMEQIAASFRRGDFAVPGFVHDQEVPGTKAMKARRHLIDYTTDSTPAGGRLRITSRDSAAVEAVHQFLAFQRQDHRAGQAENARP